MLIFSDIRILFLYSFLKLLLSLALKQFLSVENYITIAVAISFDYAIAHFANDFISECNNPTEFMFYHYYVRGGDLPSVEDIDNIIGIIRETGE